jgi:hypothetical protein
MIWDPEIVSKAIRSGFSSYGTNEISVAYWDSNLGFAVGTNANGELVAMGSSSNSS